MKQILARMFPLPLALIAIFLFQDVHAERFPEPNIGENLSEDLSAAYRWLSGRSRKFSRNQKK